MTTTIRRIGRRGRILTDTERRAALLDLARSLATRSRRCRATLCLERVRHVGTQLDALDPASREAPDVLHAAAQQLGMLVVALDKFDHWMNRIGK